MDDAQKAEIIATAHALADAAGKAILPYFRRSALDTENKAGKGAFDPVTVADRAAEEAMRTILAERRPLDGIVGEEFGTRAGESGLNWILDPIDGTRAFIAGSPSWGVLIALAEGRTPLFGLVDQPYTKERFCGGLGIAEMTGPSGSRPLRAGTRTSLAEAILLTTFPEIGTQAEREAFTRVARDVRLVRYGLDCYAYALLALGQVDLVIEAGLHVYDIAAPRAVIEAAGGIVTDWRGNPPDAGGQVLAAATPELHRAALQRLQSQG